MDRSAIADFEIKELLVRRHLLQVDDEDTLNLDVMGLRFINHQGTSVISALEAQSLDARAIFPVISELPEDPPSKDTRSIEKFKAFTAYQIRAATVARWAQIGYLNRLRCNRLPVYSRETLGLISKFCQPLLPLSATDTRTKYLQNVTLVNSAIKSYSTRAEEMFSIVDKFAFVTPAVVALDMPRMTLPGHEARVTETLQDPNFDAVLHQPSVKLQIAFPDPSLLQFDCGKLQELTRLLREKKAGGHRVLIFTQMTKILDILEIFLNFHGYLYLRLDGATKIEDRQYITERFNVDARVFCFIASSRSGGVGIK
jgi:helicase SWR1